jgi:pseudouridine synthase
MEISWFKKKNEYINRVNLFLENSNQDLIEILLDHPSDELIDLISNKLYADSRILRKCISLKRKPSTFFHYIFNKPKDFTCQPNQRFCDPKQFIYYSIPTGFPKITFAGRLDKETEGLLLFSDNGKLLNLLVDPTNADHVSKEYHVQVSFDIYRFGDNCDYTFEKNKALESIREPLDIKTSTTRSANVRLLRDDEVSDNNNNLSLNHIFWISVIISEGKNKQVRRLCARANLKVIRLIRVKFGPLNLGNLNSGEARCLTENELKSCYKLVNYPSPFPLQISTPSIQKGISSLSDETKEDLLKI